MYESISKNNELENEMTLDMSYFWYSDVVTYENPHGTISNSDLELAGHVAHNDVLARLENINSVTVASFTDNTPALYWTKKGSTSTSIPAAYLL